MKIFLISDNIDTATGLRLVGIDGVVVHEENEFKEALKKVLADSEIGILLVMEKMARDYSELINEIKLGRKLPLVVEIPDRHGTGRDMEFITSYIKEAIGVKLNK